MMQYSSRNWRERLMRDIGMDALMLPRQYNLTIPKWMTSKAMSFFFVAMFACWGVFGYVPGFDLILCSCLSVVIFFYIGQSVSKSWFKKNESTFLLYLFAIGFVIRLIWVLYLYYAFNINHFDNTYGDTADTGWYIDFGKDLRDWMARDTTRPLSRIIEINDAAFDDVGYPMWLGFIYLIFGPENDVFVPFLLKCLLGTYCAISIYRVAKRHFGEGTARMAAIFVCLNPNMIYWCGTMMKEAEMVFLCCVAVDNFDRVLSAGKRYTFANMVPGILATIALLFFRSVLGILIFLAVFGHIIMASSRVMSVGKKALAGVLVGTILVLSVGDRIRTQSEQLVESVQSGTQRTNIEWRSEREGGNSFAKYAGAAVFAPLIFTIPFPTFNMAHESHLVQVLLSGGSYIKNILSFFVIIVLLLLLISGQWRRHVFILAYTVGYHIVLVMSPFAQSGRFHMPVIPMLMLLAAYGVQMSKTNKKIKRWFSMVLAFEVIICLAWNWFKLAGRGMI